MNEKRKVIIDTDMQWDDALSILYLMKDPSIEIVGVAVTGCGGTNLRWGSTIAKSLMELGQQTQAVIAVGTETPLALQHGFPQTFKNDMNDMTGLLGSVNPKTTLNVDPRPAWQFISETLNKGTEVSILSIGGFTNLATMLQKYPSTDISKIQGVYAMAGAVYVDGNIASLNNAKPSWDQGPVYSTNYAAEWNVFIDPTAAKQVFQSRIPLTLIPLDACNYVVMEPDYANKITATDPIATLVKSLLKQDNVSKDVGMPIPIFDPLATLIMANALKKQQVQSEFLDVNTTDTQTDNQCGKTSVAASGSRKINIVQGVSQREFALNYAQMINS